jgi:small subunit ribosomal protein S16
VVVIRLARFGQKKAPKYRITVADSRDWVKGRFIEVIGHYNPNPRGQEPKLVVDVPKADSWISKGAQASLRVNTLLRHAKGELKSN